MPSSPRGVSRFPSYDAIVVGLGAMGSAAAHHLSSRGLRVLGLERFGPGHTMGSSHGESRIIRMAYFEHPNYVPLLRRAYELWERLQADSSRELMRLVGGLFIGPPDGKLFHGSYESARLYGLKHEILDAGQIRRRFPALQVQNAEVALFEPGAGILFPERCIDAFLAAAAAGGAELRHGEAVESWSPTGAGVEVRTGQGVHIARHLVLTAGPWLPRLLADLRLPLSPERIPLFWMQPRALHECFAPGRLPIYVWEVADLGVFYGFPHVERPGAKVGRHHSGELCDPDTVDRAVDQRDEARIRAFLARCIPDLDGDVAESRVCLYTNTPDGHFLIDRHPQLPQVVFAGGFSGHGFKFAPVVGEILSDLVTTGSPTPSAEFLRLSRLAHRSSGQDVSAMAPPEQGA